MWLSLVLFSKKRHYLFLCTKSCHVAFGLGKFRKLVPTNGLRMKTCLSSRIDKVATVRPNMSLCGLESVRVPHNSSFMILSARKVCFYKTNEGHITWFKKNLQPVITWNLRVSWNIVYFKLIQNHLQIWGRACLGQRFSSLWMLQPLKRLIQN